MSTSSSPPNAPADSSRPTADDLPPAPPDRIQVEGVRELRRLDWSLVGDATMGFVSLEKGFVFTLWAFLRRPRAAFESYLGADRLRFSNPLKLAVFLVALATLLNYQIGSGDAIAEGFSTGAEENAEQASLTPEQQAAMAQFIQRNANLLMLAALPLMASVTRLLYWRRAYNWIEHMALNSFLFAVTSVAYVLQILVELGWSGSGMIYLAFVVIYQTWVYRRVLGPGWLRAAAGTVLSAVAYFAVFSVVIAVVAQRIRNSG